MHPDSSDGVGDGDQEKIGAGIGGEPDFRSHGAVRSRATGVDIEVARPLGRIEHPGAALTVHEIDGDRITFQARSLAWLWR